MIKDNLKANEIYGIAKDEIITYAKSLRDNNIPTTQTIIKMEEKYYFVKVLCFMKFPVPNDIIIHHRGSIVVKEENINNISFIEANFKRLAEKEGLTLVKVEIEGKIECSEEEIRRVLKND